MLNVNDLTVSFHLADATVRAVRGVSFSIKEGETLGLVGESGCGKSVSAFSILRLTPGETGGEIIYNGRDLLSLSETEMRKIRGSEISMIFQEPMISLNPVLTVGFQVSEPFITHLGLSKKEALERSAEMLRLVGISDPEKRCRSYPHEFSGGMRQRVMIAMALAASPSLLIADEPTTALDVTIQAQILELLAELQRERKMSMLLITHDLGVVSNIADDIAIMYAGEIVEYGPASDIMSAPSHPYTIGLLEAMPRIDRASDRLTAIPGSVPSPVSLPQGCAFYPRCGMASDECKAASVPLQELSDGRKTRCLKFNR
ncbi:MAG: ABC transporter ATP-binding protein [Leptospirales bacterium]|nr:ABC transporter ATP-binding protein [Leptospirales bacterium]